MARRKKNPSTGTVLLVLAVAGGLGYWAYTKAKSDVKKGLKEGVASATETITINGWKIVIKGLGDGQYRTTVKDPGGASEDLGVFPSRDEALAAGQALVEEGLRGG